MRTQKKHWILSLTVAVVLSLTTHAHALFTTNLDAAVSALTGASNYFATLPTPTKTDKKHLSQVKKALKDLSKPSDSVAEDYNLFFLAVVHLGDLQTDPIFGPTLDQLGTNAFNAFITEAQGEFFATAGRIMALNDFVKTKRAASNQLQSAFNSLVTLSTETNKQLGLLLGRQIFQRLVKAEKLVTKGEANLGVAADSLTDGQLIHNSKDGDGTLDFTDDTNATETEGVDVTNETYTYERTGLNTATLVLTETVGAGQFNVTTVKLKFTSTGGGKFTAKRVGADGHKDSQSGTFTLTF